MASVIALDGAGATLDPFVAWPGISFKACLVTEKHSCCGIGQKL